MSLTLYPIGYLTGSLDSRGAWSVGGSAANYFFEPNAGCTSQYNDTTLISEFENHAIQTRQKIPMFRTLSYKYEDIWYKEYKMIERFYNVVKGRGGRFYVIDLSAQEKTSGYSKSGSNMTASVSSTWRFNTTAGKFGYWVAAWKPETASLMIGKVVSVSEDANVVFTASYGDLKTSGGDIYVYPVAECFFSDNLSNFNQGDFNPSDDEYGGFMYSGNVSFVQYGAG